MEIENLTFGFEAMRWLLISAIGIYTWLIGRQAASAKELLELRTRLTSLEVRINTLPSSKEFHQVAAKLESIDARLGGLETSLKPLGRRLEAINTYLLQNR